MKRISEGPLSFRDFMKMALYYPNWGVTPTQNKKSKSGMDFYTSANLSNSFLEQ
jgi:SAM-dependent MidA family methyltransferase